jgi:hypothetical protein
MTARWAAIALAACVIAPAALFVHDYMLVWLKVPYPNVVGLPAWASVLGLAVRLSALAVIVRLALPVLPGPAPLLAAGAIGVVLVMLDETARQIIIERVILDGWPYAVLDTIPSQIGMFLAVAAVAYAAIRGLQGPRLFGVVALERDRRHQGKNRQSARADHLGRDRRQDRRAARTRERVEIT